jgi:restriction system protein
MVSPRILSCGCLPHFPVTANSKPKMLFVLVMLVAPLLFLLIGLVAGRFLSFRVNLGEAIVANAITAHFHRPHVLLNNVTFKMGNETSQIDHLLIADTGIFVIETKHYSGWIFGNPNERYWTQVIYRKKSRFLNPIHQNYGHVRAVRSLFNLPENDFIPIVVFAGSAELKTDLGKTALRLPGLISFLSAERPVIFDEKKMAYIVGRIEMKRMRRSLETDEYHLNSVRHRIKLKEYLPR